MNESCCRPDSNAPKTPALDTVCPRCGSSGRPVTARLLKHQLKPAHLTFINPNDSFRFCASSNCDVIYFSANGRCFVTSDLRQLVTQKSSGRERPLCYCFGFTEGMVQDELATAGQCTIPARIKAEIKAGHCACEIRNPQGSCCLSNVVKAIEETTPLA